MSLQTPTPDNAHANSPELLKLTQITKRFPGVLANDAVSFSIHEGEIHALLGENGAGKSTLVKMIYGVLQPDAGEMLFRGAPFAPAKPGAARAAGIGMVFQHFSLFEALTVAENIALGISPELVKANSQAGGLRQRIIDISDQYGLTLDPDRLVGELSVGARQRVEIVRCLLQNPKLIIMDEPTSVLTPQEVEALFATLNRLRSEGCSILYISHKLEEIRALCDHATILRGGKVVDTCIPAEETAKSIAEMMIGTSLMAPERLKTERGAVRLKLDKLSLKAERLFGIDLEDISLEVHSGEIYGIAGVAGNGQNRLMQALIGEAIISPAEAIQLDGEPVGAYAPAMRRKKGMCFVPEERLGHGAVPDMSLIENAFLAGFERKALTRNGLIDWRTSGSFANDIIKQFNVKTAGADHAARSLSGGNLQKFIVGREILQAPSVLIASQPTWGVDAGAAADIHKTLQQLAAKGAAILLISQDLDELFAICHRLSVIANGRVSKGENIEDLTIEAIGMNMGGTNMTETQPGPNMRPQEGQANA